MRRAFGLLLVLVGPSALLSASCSDAKSARLPPPLPVPQAQPEEPPAAQPEGEAEPAPSPTSQSKAKPPAARQPSTPKAGRNTKSSPAPTPPAKPPATAKAPAVAPAPAAKAPAPAPSAPVKSAPVKSSRVTIPQLPHVRVEVPEGLQRDLDADPRMQSWLERVFTIIDGCHAQNGRALGTIEAQITMHENERPDADLRSLPPALSSVVACATGGLMRTKMPLFTGREGTRYAVRIRFQ